MEKSHYAEAGPNPRLQYPGKPITGFRKTTHLPLDANRQNALRSFGIAGQAFHSTMRSNWMSSFPVYIRISFRDLLNPAPMGSRTIPVAAPPKPRCRGKNLPVSSSREPTAASIHALPCPSETDCSRHRLLADISSGWSSGRIEGAMHSSRAFTATRPDFAQVKQEKPVDDSVQWTDQTVGVGKTVLTMLICRSVAPLD